MIKLITKPKILESLEKDGEKILILDTKEADNYLKKRAIRKNGCYKKEANAAWNQLLDNMDILKSRSWVKFEDAKLHNAYTSITLEISDDLYINDFLKNIDHLAEKIVLDRIELENHLDKKHKHKTDTDITTEMRNKTSRLRIQHRNGKIVFIVIHDTIPKIPYVPQAPPDLNHILIGHDLDYNPIYWDWKVDVSIYIAGATGSGKSTLLNTLLINCLLYTNTYFFLIDPKRQEFYSYRNKKNIVAFGEGPDLEAMTAVLMAFHDFFMNRLPLFRNEETGKQYRSLKEYNDAHSDNPLQPYVLVFDEFADYAFNFIKAGKVDPESPYQMLMRDAAKIRATGGHIILATQRPSADVLNGLLKCQFPAQIGLRMINKLNSEIAIDEMGLEDLENYTFKSRLGGQMQDGVCYFMDEAMLEKYINQLPECSKSDFYIDIASITETMKNQDAFQEEQKEIVKRIKEINKVFSGSNQSNRTLIENYEIYQSYLDSQHLGSHKQKEPTDKYKKAYDAYIVYQKELEQLENRLAEIQEVLKCVMPLEEQSDNESNKKIK